MAHRDDNAEFDKLAAEDEANSKPVRWVPASVPAPIHKGKATQRLRQVAFLKVLSECGIVSKACKAIGINVGTERLWRVSKDSWYDRQFKDALQAYRDSIETEVHDRAVNGVEVPIIGRVQRQVGTDVDGNPIFAAEDAVIATKTVKSDLLLMFHAKRHIPEYREKYEAKDDGDQRRPGDNASPLARITLRLEMIGKNNQKQIESPRENVIDITPEVQQLPESVE